MKTENDSLLHAHVVIKTSTLEFGGADFTSSLCRVPQKYVPKFVLQVHHDYLCSFDEYRCLVALLPWPSLFVVSSAP